ncbi:hypothetical protein OHB26_37275 [Nocardia sp. NBC_01503]|nr:hypothetical protein [Nocardia sp. NBC_01503]WTL32451.1 hypothetical protein OHB26_37275 [Nocardia sp. NBC_01503]
MVRGQREGDLRADLDPEAAAWMVLSFLSAHGFRAAVMPNRRHLEEHLAAMTLRVLVNPDAAPE